jgi:hypothetical protein
VRQVHGAFSVLECHEQRLLVCDLGLFAQGVLHSTWLRSRRFESVR